MKGSAADGETRNPGWLGFERAINDRQQTLSW
jgi:hypothetical protein